MSICRRQRKVFETLQVPLSTTETLGSLATPEWDKDKGLLKATGKGRRSQFGEDVFLGGGFKDFLFSPLFGGRFPF